MKFPLPDPWAGSFYVPDSWLQFSEIKKFKKTIEFYIPNIDEFELVQISNIVPPTRSPNIKGLHKCRTVSLLCGILHGERLPPVILAKENTTYKLKEGFHRYHVSIIAGFTQIPALLYE